MSEYTHYQLLDLLAERPATNQRQLARDLGLSLGKINYCLQALLAKGWIKSSRFRHSNNKLAYAYLLTPQGIDAKARLAADFLQRKLAEYEALEQDIARLRRAVAATQDPNP